MPVYNPWYDWTQTSASTTTINTWQAWMANGTTGLTGVGNNLNTWAAWTTTYQITYADRTWVTWNEPVPVAAVLDLAEVRRQQEAYQRRRDEIGRENEEYNRRRAVAVAKAKALLLDHLEPEQARSYVEHGHFDLEVGSRTFRINRGSHGNVQELHVQDGKELVIRSFCIPSRIWNMPEPDVHLTQKLMLEGGEESLREFHRIANITERARPRLRAGVV